MRRSERKSSKSMESAGQPCLHFLIGMRSCSRSLIRCIPDPSACSNRTARRFYGSTYPSMAETGLPSSHRSQSIDLAITTYPSGLTRSITPPAPSYYLTNYQGDARKTSCGIFASTTTSGVPVHESNLLEISLHGSVSQSILCCPSLTVYFSGLAPIPTQPVYQTTPLLEPQLPLMTNRSERNPVRTKTYSFKENLKRWTGRLMSTGPAKRDLNAWTLPHYERCVKRGSSGKTGKRMS